MQKFFKLKENGTKVSTEVVAGITTFFAMAYIIAVNPGMLSQAGMEWGAVFLATIISSIVGTLVMALCANVPYALAPGMGLNAFFVFTVCFALQFTWQQALSMVFICGLLNILITVTKIRQHLIHSIPKGLQCAIGGGIGVFLAYLGLLNAGFINFDAGIPAMPAINTPQLWVFAIGLVLIVVLYILKIKGAILIGIIAITLIGIPFGLTTSATSISFTEAANQLTTTFGVIFTPEGLPSLFADASKIPLVLITIFSFSLTDTFDTIGTFVGTGRQTGIFKLDEFKAADKQSGFKTKLDRALFADATATSIGAVFGTSNTTTYVESAAGISVGGRTGLTGVVVAICLAVSMFFAPFVSAIPSVATAPALVLVGIMMMSSFKEINWTNMEDAIPAFFAGIFMALSYSISYGIALGFMFYCIIKLARRKSKDIHLLVWVTSALFLVNFIFMATL